MTRRRIIGLAVGGFVLLVGLYGAAWFIVADRLQDDFDRWATERRAEGWTVEHGDISITGFPLSWQAHVVSPRLAQPTRKPFFLWSGPSLDMSWRPWEPKIVDFRTSGTHHLGIGTTDESRTAPLTMTAARGHLIFGPGGRLGNLTLQINDATIPVSGGGTLQIAGIASTTHIIPRSNATATGKPHLNPALIFDTEFAGVTLPANSRPALGRTIKKLSLRGAILGHLPTGTVKEAISAWRDSGGTLEVERLELGWASLSVRADGTMALDPALQPVGAFRARIAGYSETMDALVASGLVKPGQALLAKFALGALARTPDGGGRPELRVPISLQDGWLFVGPVKLLRLPPVKWR